MGDRDSIPSPFDDIHPFPFMQDPPPSPHHHQHFNNFPENSSPNPYYHQNPCLRSSRNPITPYQNSCSASASCYGSGSGFAGNAGIQEVESLMGGLRLSENPYRVNAPDVRVYSGLYDQNHYLREMRIRDAVLATMGAPQGFNFNNNNYSLSSRNYGLGYGGRVMNNVQPYFSWRLYLVALAKTKDGCRILQEKIKEGEPEEIEAILSGLQYHLHELITHRNGNYVIEKIFQSTSLTLEQMNIALTLLLRDVRKLQSVCMDVIGTRVIQKIMEKLNTHSQQYLVTLVMRLVTKTLMKNANGSYVIQQCVKLFPPEYKKVILEEIAHNCVDIAMDRCGSSAIQKCLGHAEGQAIFSLVHEIILNASVLSQDPYGNYLVQYLIQMELNEPPANKLMIQHLSGGFVGLSMDKHASNVMEALLQFSEPNDVAVMVEEIMNSPEFFNVLRDPYGNFVIQTAMECTQGNLRKSLCYFISNNCGFLHSHLYGKNVLAFAKRCRIDD